LLSNAIKYTPPGGSVSIAATVTSDDMVAIEVVDTGIGIASDDLNRVFEPFRRGDTSVARTHEGTGLGLAITKRLVELSGGKLCLESEVGLGTSVKVWLPATPPDALAANDRVRA
jgi:signal transduction histidine kinase